MCTVLSDMSAEGFVTLHKFALKVICDTQSVSSGWILQQVSARPWGLRALGNAAGREQPFPQVLLPRNTSVPCVWWSLTSPVSADLLFGLPGRYSGVSLYNRRRVVSYTVTLGLQRYDSR